MGRLKKWNNQGGSSRGEKPQRDKKALPIVPQFESLPESLVTSFRLPKLRKSVEVFGDEIPTDWELFVDDEFPELDEDDLELPELDPNPQTPPNTFPPTTPPILPYAVFDEYEIVVKYRSITGLLVLTISSGQAYASRNQVNDSRYDFSIVVDSSEPIQVSVMPTGSVNIIQSSNPNRDPILSLYLWLISKLSIATNNDGNGSEPILDAIDSSGLTNITPLPSTNFIWNSNTYSLFYGTGIEPIQICLHAVNKVLKFTPSHPNPTYFWSVTSTGDPLPLCRSLLPTVFISIASGFPTTIDPNNNTTGQFFRFVISVDAPILVDLPVWFGISGTASNSFYSVTGIGFDSNSIAAFIIPANSQFTTVDVIPLPNPSQVGSKSITISLVPNPVLYDIGFSPQTVLLEPVVLPIVSLSIAPGSPSSINPASIGGQIFVFRISIDTVQTSNFLVKFDFAGTAIDPDDYFFTNPVLNSSFIINPGDTYVDINVFPVANFALTSDKIIELRILPDPTKYNINVNSQSVILAGRKPAIVIRTFIDPLPVSPDPSTFFVESQFSNFNIRPYVYGSNISQSTITANSLASNPKLGAIGDGIGITDPPFREYLIDNETIFGQNPYLDSYGRLNNFYFREYVLFDGVTLQGARDLFISKQLMQDWMQSVSLRYLTIHPYYEVSFDSTAPISPDNTDRLIPEPPRNFNTFLDRLTISFGSTDTMPALAAVNEFDSFTYSLFDNALYPVERTAEYADGKLNPIQLNNIQYQAQHFANTPLFTASQRSIWVQAALEFDIQTDPNLLSPRIIPVVLNPGLVNGTVSIQGFPFQQIS
jgi:hypothetical protein